MMKINNKNYVRILFSMVLALCISLLLAGCGKTDESVIQYQRRNFYLKTK